MSSKCAVIIPAGPADDIEDTLESVFHFMAKNTTVIVVDDMRDPERSRRLSASADSRLVIVTASGATGKGGRLWRRDCQGFEAALRETSAEVFLRLDADALVIGYGSDSAAADYFDQRPDVGALGSCYRTSTGDLRDFAPARAAFQKSSSLIRRVSSPKGRAIHSLGKTAKANGWRPGEHALGAGVFLARRCIESIAGLGLLDQEGLLTRSALEDDWILGAAVYAAGYRIEDFTAPGQPVAVAWRGLPEHPKDLLKHRRCVIHSVRAYGAMRETEIREGFRTLRREQSTVWPS